MSSRTSQSLPEPLPEDPLQTAATWLQQSFDEAVQPNPNSMTLATVGSGGRPSARIVLCKGIVLPQGYLLFFTNYESRKGAEMAAHARVAAVIHWDTLHRQVRVEGFVVKSPARESDDYFASRPWQSRLGAWASEQSRPVGGRQQLIEQLRNAGRRFGTPPVGPDAEDGDDSRAGVTVPRPPHWGGYRLWADAVELWVEGKYRIHDRARWTRSLTPVADSQHFETTPWHAERLQP